MADLNGNRGGRQDGSVHWTQFVGALGFVLVLVVVAYFGNRVERMEDRLRDAAPTFELLGDISTTAIDQTRAQTVYVPAYSHIYSKGGEPFLLETMLSIRNTDPENGINVARVDYYDTEGKLVEGFVKESRTLGPLETAEYLVPKRDVRGGSGANFIVRWDAGKPVYEPVIEAVMIGIAPGYQISFISPGRPLSHRIADPATSPE